MIELPNILMIGATERKLGKTTFATEIIRRYRNKHPVVAVKITTLNGQSTGNTHESCDSPDGGYSITEELTGPAGKGTTRLLDAGAARVFWMKVHRTCINEAVNDLFQRIPGNSPVICESNSARAFIKPSLFLVIKRKGSEEIKESCGNVIKFANRVIEFNGSGWNLEPDKIVFNGSRWLIT